MPRLLSGAISLTFCLVILAGAGSSPAGVVVSVPVDLGGEEFEISPNSRLQEAFAGVHDWTVVENVQLRLVGRHTCQFAYCAEGPSYAVGATEGAIAWGFMVGEAETYRTEREFSCVPEGEDFDLTLSFAAGETPDWSFLAEGTGTLFVEHERTADGCIMFAVFVGVDAYLTTVELLVELPDTVPVSADTWGAIKARYR